MSQVPEFIPGTVPTTSQRVKVRVCTKTIAIARTVFLPRVQLIADNHDLTEADINTMAIDVSARMERTRQEAPLLLHPSGLAVVLLATGQKDNALLHSILTASKYEDMEAMSTSPVALQFMFAGVEENEMQEILAEAAAIRSATDEDMMAFFSDGKEEPKFPTWKLLDTNIQTTSEDTSKPHATRK